MRLHRFFVDVDLKKPIVAVKDPSLCHQLMNVLRLQKGDKMILCDGDNHEAVGEIEKLNAESVQCAILERREVTAEPKRNVTLYCSVLKRENFEWVVEKATEAGVKTIVPIITERTVKVGLKMERLQVIAKEAAEQSGRGVIPNVHEPISFVDALNNDESEVKIFFHISHDQAPTSYQLQATSSLWIGPEGGWTDAEVRMAEESHFIVTSLGTLTLRAETAAIIASYRAVSGI